MFVLLGAPDTHAGEADVLDVKIKCDESRRCSLRATVRHDDTGWAHYADHWRVLDPNGRELGRRVLLHPHETEQPFTRGLPDLQIPGAVDRITVEAHDNVHGYGGQQVTLTVDP